MMSPNTSHASMERYDVVIVGAGMVGLSLALGLSKKSKQTLKVALIDFKQASSPESWQGFDPRVSAITQSSKNFLSNVGVWENIEHQGICQFKGMDVWEQDGTASIQFNAADLGEHELGYIVENRIMQWAMYEEANRLENIDFVFGDNIESFEHRVENVEDTVPNDNWEISFASGRVLQGALLVGCDGANSFMRSRLGFELEQKALGHDAIVCTVKTERHHEHVARQRFLQTGPLAFLPLPKKDGENYCSIVWSQQPEQAKELLTLSDDEFCQRLNRVFEERLGCVESCSQRFCFPLIQRHVKNYSQNAAVLLGDAAHTIHPLAGQGVNLGYMDAAVLVDEVCRARQRKVPINSQEVLRRFERQRRLDNTLMMGLVVLFQKLFAADDVKIRALRNMGVGLGDKIPVIKQHLLSEAMGLKDNLPTLANALWNKGLEKSK